MYRLIVTIVPHNTGELITKTAVKAGASGSTILMGRGTAENAIIQLLGLGDSEKDITWTLVSDEEYRTVFDEIKNSTLTKKAHFGIMFSINVNSFSKAGKKELIQGGSNMADKSEGQGFQVLNVIVNKGYAEDAMAAARKAGAGGGTIIGARGTAKEGDAKFFGMDIVPEKELLLIIVPEDKKAAVTDAISELPCFSKAGSGIIFSSSANDFIFLGKETK